MPAFDGTIVVDSDDSFTAIERYANKGGLFKLKVHQGERFVFVLSTEKEI